MYLKSFNPDKELKKLNHKYTKKNLIITIIAIILLISIGSSYAIFSIEPEYHTFIKGTVGNFSIKKSMIETLLEQYNEKNAEYGLLKDSENPNIYYYKGTRNQVANNYLWYGGHQWQVVEFNVEEETLKMITTQPITNISLAYSPWKSLDDYVNSYINMWLKEEFYDVLTNEIKNNIVLNRYNIGEYNSEEETIVESKYGLLNYSQYFRAGEAGSYLDIDDNFMLSNLYENNFSYISNSLHQIGTILKGNNAAAFGIRPVIKINDIYINGGNGTLSNPFNNNLNISTNTDNVMVGEYISVPTNSDECGSDKKCLFRVVKREDNGNLKIVLNGTLKNYSIFGTSQIFDENQTVYNYIKTFAESINTEYRSTVSHKLPMGKYSYSNCITGINLCGMNYKETRTTYFSSSFGLISYGDMFAANDIDLDSYGIFVDRSTIENILIPNKKHSVDDPENNAIYLFLMNSLGTGVAYINDNSYFSNHPYDTPNAVRPVIFLKNNLQFTGGSGTAQDPYILN